MNSDACKCKHTMDDNLLYDEITEGLTEDQWKSIALDPCTKAQVQYQHELNGQRGETTLMKAIRCKAPLAITSALLKIGETELLHQTDCAGNTALMKAIECGTSPAVVRALLDVGGKKSF